MRICPAAALFTAGVSSPAYLACPNPPCACVRACVGRSRTARSVGATHSPTHALTHSPAASVPPIAIGPIHKPLVTPTPLALPSTRPRTTHASTLGLPLEMATETPEHESSVWTPSAPYILLIFPFVSSVPRVEGKSCSTRPNKPDRNPNKHVGSIRGSDERLRGDSRPHYHE